MDTIVSRDVMLSGPSNFRLWQSTQQSILKRGDLWDVVTADLPPAQQTLPSKETSPSAINDPRDPPKVFQATFSTSGVTSTSSIRNTIRRKQEKTQILHPALCSTRALCLYQRHPKSTSCVEVPRIDVPNKHNCWHMVVLNKWETLLMTEQMDVSTFITKVFDIQRELIAIGQPQSNVIRVHKVLNRLPSRFHSLAWQIQNERDIPSLEKLSTRLHNEDNLISMRQDEPEEAFTMRISNVVQRRYKPQ